jgi:hypothetical protein
MPEAGWRSGASRFHDLEVCLFPRRLPCARVRANRLVVHLNLGALLYLPTIPAFHFSRDDCSCIRDKVIFPSAPRCLTFRRDLQHGAVLPLDAGEVRSRSHLASGEVRYAALRAAFPRGGDPAELHGDVWACPKCGL